MSRTHDTMECARQLIHIPILHSPADMGTMGDMLATAYIERFGRGHWEDFLVAIESFWRTVCAELERLDLDYRQVNLYQDGLPVCGRELQIVRKAAAMGGENYRLLLDLTTRGATLMGTEDPNLLLREYRNVENALKNDRATPQTASDTDNLSKRDAYIGWRIDESLRPGRTGILFLGMTHNIEPALPVDIVIRRLVPHPTNHKERQHHGHP